MNLRDAAREHRREADSHRRDGDFLTAGDYYMLGAYARFATGVPHLSDGIGLQYVLRAGTCYRLGGRLDRCRNVCEQGILRAEDRIDRVFSRPEPEYFVDRAARGIWHEYIGDFRVLAELEANDEAYDDAVTIYEEAGDPDLNSAETRIRGNISYFHDLAAGVSDEAVAQLEEHTGYGTTFTEWVAFKRDQYPVLIEKLLERGSWTWE